MQGLLLTDEESEGEELPEMLKQYVEDKLKNRMQSDKLKKKVKRQRTPKNVKLAVEQKLNPPIFNQLSRPGKYQDNELKRIQGLMVKSVIAFSKVAKEVMALQKENGMVEKQEIGNKLFDDTFDGLALAAQACYNINMKRVS